MFACGRGLELMCGSDVEGLITGMLNLIARSGGTICMYVSLYVGQ